MKLENICHMSNPELPSFFQLRRALLQTEIDAAEDSSLLRNFTVKQLEILTRKSIAVINDAMRAKRARAASPSTLAKHHPWCL